MKKYTLTSYDPVELDLPKPQVPASLVDAQIEKLLEPMAEYHEIAEERGVAMGDHVVVTTVDARLDGNPASNFVLEHSLYHVGGGEMPRTFDEELVGMVPGETKDAEAKIKLPLAKDGDASRLTMQVTVEKILSCRTPELTDAFVAEHFEPAKTVAEFREGVAKQFGLPDMAKNDAQFPCWTSWRSAWWRTLTRPTCCRASPWTRCASRAPSTRSPTTWTSSSPTPTSRRRCPATMPSSARRSASSWRTRGWATRPGCSRAARPRSRGW